MPSLPNEIPVLTLPNTVFFPRTVIPLHIFEPRYRAMLHDVLETHRFFAVATLDRARIDPDRDPEPPHPIATVGMIRACQKCDDGTSDLLLEGYVRIEIQSITQEKPYRVVKAIALPDSTEASESEIRRLGRQLRDAMRLRTSMGVPFPKQVEHVIRDLKCAATMCDILLFTSVGDVSFKQRMLATTDTAKRLRLTAARLRHEAAQAGLHKRLQGPLGDDDIAHN